MRRDPERAEIPVKKRFSIWSEGYAATGERGRATFMGTSSGRDFRDACIRYFDRLAGSKKTPEEQEEYRGQFNGEHLTFWGCKLFDNARDARKSYG